MFKSKPYHPPDSCLKELTIEDITNNLRKPNQNDFLDLENIYDFLNTVTVSKGKSGFVTIKKPETRKRSYEPFRDDQDFKEISTSPKSSRDKSSIGSPVLASTQASSKSTLRKTIRGKLSSIEESKKKVKVSNKSLLTSPKTVKKSIFRVKSKEKGIFDVDLDRIHTISPYGINLMKSCERLPILKTLKKGKSEIKLKKSRKKSKDAKKHKN